METHQLDLPTRLSAVGAARHWVNHHCGHVLGVDGRQVLELLTSEVVANAVLHGREPLRLDVRCAPGEVVVAVLDGSGAPPVETHVDAEATGGRGVALVAALSHAWGWEPVPSGKRVWFHVVDGHPVDAHPVDAHLVDGAWGAPR